MSFLLSPFSFSSVTRSHPNSISQSSLVRCAAERQRLFSRIAPVYDNVLNDLLSFGQHRVWKRMAVSWSGVQKGDTVLDLCCGSGDLAFLLSEKVGPGGKVIGYDFSKEQLSIALSRQDSFQDRYRNIEWVEGDATDLSIVDCYFDAITIGYGLRNVVNKRKVVQEMFRVTKPGAKVAVLDFNKSSQFLPSMIQGWIIDNVVVPVASRYGLSDEYKYLKSSIQEYLTGKELEKLSLETGFSTAKYYEFAGGLMGNLVATH